MLTTSELSSLTPEARGDNCGTENWSAAADCTLVPTTSTVPTQGTNDDLEKLFDSLGQHVQVFGHIRQNTNIITPLLPSV